MYGTYPPISVNSGRKAEIGAYKVRLGRLNSHLSKIAPTVYDDTQNQYNVFNLIKLRRLQTDSNAHR